MGRRPVVRAKRDAERAAIKGAYVPAWTYDVNARNGQVQGERPYSSVKITLFVLTIIAIIFGIYAMSHR